jgi:hypothetical protein
MLNNTCLPICFWGKALLCYARLLNMCPLAAIPANTTPYKMANKQKPNYLTLCVFGCRAWAHVRKDKRKSLKPHAKSCVFLGIPDNFKGWKLWDSLAQGGRGSVIISHNIVCNKEEFPGTSKTTLDPIPARFGCPADAEPVLEAPEHKEMKDNSDNAGGALRRPCGTLDVGLDPGRPRDSSSGSLLSLSSNSEDSEPPSGVCNVSATNTTVSRCLYSCARNAAPCFPSDQDSNWSLPCSHTCACKAGILWRSW